MKKNNSFKPFNFFVIGLLIYNFCSLYSMHGKIDSIKPRAFLVSEIDCKNLTKYIVDKATCKLSVEVKSNE